MKIVIIGGVAGGASAAARARRLGEDAEIIVLERGQYPSFANCGLPYYVGGEIQSRDKLLVAPVEMLRNRHRLDVRVRSEVTQIDRQNKTVQVRDLNSGTEYAEPYDKLIIATGAAPFKPPIPGIDSELVMGLRDLADADRMHQLATSGKQRAVIVGAGFIGIEVAENLRHRGMDVTIVELADQILPPWDHEMIAPMDHKLRSEGIEIRLSDSATAFKEVDGGLQVELKSGDTLAADFVVLSVGVRPENRLAIDAQIECGSRGGIVTNEHMQTNDSDVYAVGDVVQVDDYITHEKIQIPLAGPANRQGRIAADHIFGRSSSYRGTQGTAIVGAFGMSAAMVGQSEKLLRRAGTTFEKVYIHPSDHAGYYPGASPMTLKLLFDRENGAILGAQGVGSKGVDKRIDVIAMAIQAKLTVEDLEEAELCYAPQFGHAKDPINMLGFVASGVLRGDHPVTQVDRLPESPATGGEVFLLDVRSEAENSQGHIPGAHNIPIEQLRDRLDELPKDKPIAAYCQVGMRGYLATRVLMHHGFDVHNLSGGYKAWLLYHPA
ncbi:FAD-dependent oxidoreductase [Rhodopirellula sp. MGV]|uniref:FAD-dependent oxidoreductase n=1 Tax=Rhodopirellula sp. MGV TaxID=2023130 RepID=UPI000B967E7D|nr:FAD-dependent oxidoreductase [Rhodopirellula sp. MGV]OYP36530.1 CoA-disulfide reductase [Rhodopirellula sp. MGV]PNY34506.1 CoA-disulfide reductase [Rhodopirellula baltica]